MAMSSVCCPPRTVRRVVPVDVAHAEGQGGSTAPGNVVSRCTATRRSDMNPIGRPPALVRWTLGLEEATALDGPVQALEPHVRSWFGTGTRGSVLRGDWLGHAIHP